MKKLLIKAFILKGKRDVFDLRITISDLRFKLKHQKGKETF